MADALVATINWNGREFVLPMIKALLPQLKATGTSLLVFDNGSTDGSPELVESEFSETGIVTVVRNQENIGFGPAANRIIRDCSFPVVVLINTDTVVQEHCLERLLSVMELRPDVGFAGPCLLWPDGTLQQSKRDFPFPMNLVRENIPLLRGYTSKYSSHTSSGYTDWLIGAMMAIRTAPFNEIGGFSTDFMFFHEETDLQYRMTQNGWRTWYEASAKVMHHEGGACRKVFGKAVYIQHIPGKMIFLERNGKPYDRFVYRLLMSALQLKRMIAGLLFEREDPRWSISYCSKALQLLWRKGY